MTPIPASFAPQLAGAPQVFPDELFDSPWPDPAPYGPNGLPHVRAGDSSRTLDIVCDFLMDAEGYVLDAYQDAGGVWTIGVGHTGPDVHEGLSITPQECAGLLHKDASVALAAVLCEVGIPLADKQAAALCSFVFNVGIHAFETSTLLERLNSGDITDVPHQLMRWVYDTEASPDPIDGLINRRKAEVKLWRAGCVEALSADQQGEYNRPRLSH